MRILRPVLLACLPLFLVGCGSGPCNPSPLLIPVLIPVTLVGKATQPLWDKSLKPIRGGDTVDHPFVLQGEMSEAELREAEAKGYFSAHGFIAPGAVSKYVFLSAGKRKIDAVYYSRPQKLESFKVGQPSAIPRSDGPLICYYFDVSAVTIIDARPNQTPEPTTMSVTPPAAQEPRQP